MGFLFFRNFDLGPFEGPPFFFVEYFPLYLCIDFCLFCFLPTGHSFWPRNLIFWHSNPWDMSQKRIFFFSKFWFLALWGAPKGQFSSIFLFILCISICLFCYQPTGYSFWPRNLIFWHSTPWDMSQKFIFFFFRNFHFC